MIGIRNLLKRRCRNQAISHQINKISFKMTFKKNSKDNNKNKLNKKLEMVTERDNPKKRKNNRYFLFNPSLIYLGIQIQAYKKKT